MFSSCLSISLQKTDYHAWEFFSSNLSDCIRHSRLELHLSALLNDCQKTVHLSLRHLLLCLFDPISL
jgi:hypothetical protein